MWKSKKNNQIDILQKTQENLELTQKNNQMLLEGLSNILNTEKNVQRKIPKTDEEKLQAAYALNLCTVSVSQIIDYNDIYFMENEYDAILNNLNLENMPKDEALLRILKQLLDVITFFRIQDGDRKMMEREYEQRIKNAIWSAIPNPSMIVTGGNPVSIAISLASQVGTGYMNYRKEKAQINLDKERKEWELQRSAIEQFNGLRRELFDTAWRLADEYEFSDEYRITERQITQFNDILLDTDALRRYERLDYIKDKFKAYPPFWYYLGHAANEVYLDESYDIDFRHQCKNIAIGYFCEFDKITKNNLMREDQLVASCALEHFDLIIDKQDNKEKILLLEKATKSSGNALDVQQICAISYLKIGETNKACELLKMLVNENYNTDINAQLLSRLYISQYINEKDTKKLREYELLAMRYPTPQRLFPKPEIMPETEAAEQELDAKFIESQKYYLTESYLDALIDFIKNCEIKYYRICKRPGNIASEMAEFILEITDSVQMLAGDCIKNTFLYNIREAINKNNSFKTMITNSDSRTISGEIIDFDKIFSDAFIVLAKNLRENIKYLSKMHRISQTECALQDFIVKNDLMQNLDNSRYYDQNKNTFDSIEAIFDESYLNSLKTSRAVENCTKILEKYDKSKIIINSEKANFIKKGDPEFRGYLDKKSSIISRKYIDENSIIAVIDDKTLADTDFIFTTTHLSIIARKRFNKEYYCSYSNIRLTSDGEKIKLGNHKFSNEALNLTDIFKLIQELAAIAGTIKDETNNNLYEEIKKIFNNQENI